MRFVFFDDFKPGVLSGDQVVDISSLLDGAGKGPRAALSSFIERSPELGAKVAQLQRVPGTSVRLRQPVPDPAQLLCAIVNYREPGREVREADFFLKSPVCIIGPGDTIKLPANRSIPVFHHEAELAVVIKREADNVPASRAMDYVFGYTGFIDVSARNIGSSFYMKKSFATFGPMGPALVTADEIPDPHNLRVRLWVNDDLRQDYSTSDMANRIDRLIEVASAVCPLMPGDVIATGTHHLGLGPLQEGDNVTLEIERIGRMSCRVEDPLHRKWDAKAPDGGRSGPIG